MQEFKFDKTETFGIKKKNCISKSSLPLFLILACKKLDKVAFFTHNVKSMIDLKEEIQSFGTNIEVIMFPEFDCNFFSNISPTKEILIERIKTLYKVIFQKNKKIIFIGSYESLITKTIPKASLENIRFSLKKSKTS